MSTKTTFKRVALVAVAALGFGMLSAVPSNATAPTYNVFAPSQTTVLANSTSTTAGWVIPTVASTGGYVTLTALTSVGSVDSLQLTVTGGTILSAAAASKTWTCSGSGGFSAAGTTSGSSVSTSGLIVSGSKLLATDITLSAANTNGLCTAWTGTVLNPAAYINIGTSTAGTITATLSSNLVDSSTGISTSTVLETFVIVVAAAASTSYAKTKVVQTIGGANTDVDGVIHTVSTATTTAATFTAEQVNNLGAPLATAASKAVTVTLSGTAGSLSPSGPSSSFLYVPAATWVNTTPGSFSVYSDGRAGNATLTVAVNGVTVDTESFNFYSLKVASITAVAIYSIAPKNGGTSGALSADLNDSCDSDGLPVAEGDVTTIDTTLSCPSLTNRPAIALISKDAGGNVVPVVPTMSSSDATVVISGNTGTFVDNGQGAASAGWGYVHTSYTTATASVSGAKASLTYTYLNSDGTLITSSAVPVTLGGSPAVEVLTLDKAEYQPGESLVVTFTATDSSGNPVADGTAIASGLTSTRALNGAALPTSTKRYVGGKYSMKADKTFAPSTTGAFKLSATSSNLAGDTISVTGTVVLDSVISALLSASADAAAEATDAANAATDAANAAAEAADAATAAAQDASDAVAALSAQVAILIAGLKAQLTALTNLIIKIQKKLKA